MPSRALAFAVALAFTTDLCTGVAAHTCTRDGLYADYETNCREYIRCLGGVVTGRYSCGPGRTFSEAAGACVSQNQQLCIRRKCAIDDTFAYATPGTACRQYYRCDNESITHHICPSGAWFDFERQSCTHGAGACYEPLCAGLPNGDYPDASHDCRRILHCNGAELYGVSSCRGGKCTKYCPPPRSSSIPLPAGDANFCSDEACTSLCQHAEDGAYADKSTGCREYFVCEAKRVIRRGVCEAGLLFSGRECEPAQHVSCPAPGRSPCFNRADGFRRDYRDCSSWFECRRERVVTRGTCERGLVWDGTACVLSTVFECELPEASSVCEGRPSGTYQDFDSNCTRYFHCEGGLRMGFKCQPGHIFDGAKCTPESSYLCPSLERESCYGRPNGQYRSHETGCRGYYVCIEGEKTVYACAPGNSFDGDACRPAQASSCPRDDYSCTGLADGYHAEHESNCHRYFYCAGGDRLATLSCLGGKIFDGRACVDVAQYECGAPPQKAIENNDRFCEQGFFIQQGTECRSYYFCVEGKRTYLTCPLGQVFNGQVCSPKSQFSCPG